MTANRFRMRLWFGLLGLLLMLFTATSGVTADWTSKGGSPLRQSNATAPVGLFDPQVYWTLDQLKNGAGQVFGPGQSATQPIVVGQYAYHLAGAHLWRIDLSSSQGQPRWRRLDAQVQVGLDHREGMESAVRAPTSSPTYSPHTGMIYFGTAYGWLWRFDTKTEKLKPIELDGCPVVTSPLVLHIDGRDVVVVGDKANEECPESVDGSPKGGNVWVIWDLDRLDRQPQKTAYSIGGWVTPSPVKGDADNRFIAAADGVACEDVQGNWQGSGRILMLEVIPDDRGGFSIDPTDWNGSTCSPNGIAATLAATDDAVYWVDTEGWLHGRSLTKGRAIWEQGPAKVPQLIGGDRALGFSNTEPAIDTESDTIVVTLRNYVSSPEERWLRGCNSHRFTSPCDELGAPGAVAALALSTGKLKWSARLPAGPDANSHPAINTAPLILKARNAVIFGDVNGDIHSHSLSTGAPQPFMASDQCRPLSSYSVLHEGELPQRGPASFSQMAGIGSDPMLASGPPGGNPVMLLGLNYQPPGGVAKENAWRYGRLIAIRAGNAYNLRWEGAPATLPAAPWRAGTQVTFQGVITLEETDQRLGQLRNEPIPVAWVLVDQTGAKVRDLGQSTLPGSLASGEQVPVALSFQVQATDPAEASILGIIDPPTLIAFDPSVTATLGLASACPMSLREAAELRTDDNYTTAPFQKRATPNFSVRVDAPTFVTWEAGKYYDLTIHVTNHGDDEATVPVSAWIDAQTVKDWSLGERLVTVPAGQTVTTTRQVYLLRCKDVYVGHAEVNPGALPSDELDLADNHQAAGTVVAECGQVAVPSFVGGPGKTFIVPSDCVVSRDFSQGKICEGAGPTFDPWWD